MKITMIAHTSFEVDRAYEITERQWIAGDEKSQDLVEFAGRSCYLSWNRPNPKTATNEGYIQNILNQEHYSVLEHGTVTFFVEKVSRSLTHELVRHRHLSFSQLSQRFVSMNRTPVQPIEDELAPYVMPPIFEGDRAANAILSAAWSYATHAYDRLMERAMAMGVEGKKAKEAARAVLPNMTPTAIVVSGNHRSWREFLAKRGSLAADAEIRRMAVAVWRILSVEEPNLYQDFTLSVNDLGESLWQTLPADGG